MVLVAVLDEPPLTSRFPCTLHWSASAGLLARGDDIRLSALPELFATADERAAAYALLSVVFQRHWLSGRSWSRALCSSQAR